MSATGLVQAALFVAIIIVLAVLVQMDGGVSKELAAIKLPTMPASSAPSAHGSARGAAPTGLGVTGALNGVSNATSASMNRSMETLQNRGR
jgi:hypothetical protein